MRRRLAYSMIYGFDKYVPKNGAYKMIVAGAEARPVSRTLAACFSAVDALRHPSTTTCPT